MATKLTKIQNGKGPQFVFTFQWKALNSINGDSPIVKMDGWEDDPQSEIALEVGCKKMCDYNPKKDGVSAIAHLNYVEFTEDNTLRLGTHWSCVDTNWIERGDELTQSIFERYQSVIAPYIYSMIDEIDVEPQYIEFMYKHTKLNVENCDSKISTSPSTAKQQFNFTNKFGIINLQ
jgi:hypothetical protein